jgi:glycosyltransferase involved in cell wall biosynthesis
MLSQTSELLCDRILVLVTEDWFVLSHFKPLLAVLKDCAREVVVVTRASGRSREVAGLSVRVVDFDFRRSSINPLQELWSALKLARIMRTESPDVVHLVSMKPMVLGSVAIKLTRIGRVVMHVTGFGLLRITSNWLLRFHRKLALSVITSALRKPYSYLLVENPCDLQLLRDAGAQPGSRFTVLNGGAGVDPNEYQTLPPPNNEIPMAAYVGRMIRSKGVDVLMQAYDHIGLQRKQLRLELYGRSDEDNREAIHPRMLNDWCNRSGAVWRGHVSDIREVWKRADIFVLPSLGGEGMPRALLEAAACGRPLVVTAVPGNRDFVRNGIEGFVVPPNDPAALADAILRLASDRQLRVQMGNAARARLLQSFSEAHVKDGLRVAYQSLFAIAPHTA